MTTGFSITCINKNRNGMIVRLGGDGWSLDIHDAIVRLVSRQIRLTLMMANQYVDIGVRGEGFDSYLVIEPDATPLHLVDGIPSC